MIQRDASGRIQTEGRRRFCIIVAKTTFAELHDRLHVSKQTISDLTGGRHLPSLRLAIVIESAYGIPCAAWKLMHV